MTDEPLTSHDYGVPSPGASWFVEGHNDTDSSGTPHIICAGYWLAMAPEVGWTGDGKAGHWDCGAPGPDGAGNNCKFGWSVPIPAGAAKIRITTQYLQTGTDSCRFAWGTTPGYYSGGDNSAGTTPPTIRTYNIPQGATKWYIEGHNDWSTAIRTICSGIYQALDANGVPLSPVDPTLQYLGSGGNPNQNDPTATLAEPVNTFSGNYTTSSTDLSLPGRGIGVNFVRTYNSARTTTGPLGPGWTHPYAVALTFEADNVVLFASDDGAVIPFVANGSGGYNPGPGVLSTLTSEGSGYAVKRPDQVTYHFDSTGRLTSESDRNGNAVTLSYVSGDLHLITDPVGRALTLDYDPSHRLSLITDPIGRTVGYTYDGSGHLATVTDVRHGVTSYTYDANGRLETIVDQLGHTVVSNEFSPDGRLVAQEDAVASRTRFQWDPATSSVTTTDGRGATIRDVYTGTALTARTDGENHTTTYGYDSTYNTTSVQDPRLKTTTMTYDARGNLLTITAPAPLNYQSVFTYDSKNDILTARDARLHTLTNTYDTAGNLTRTTYEDTTFDVFTRDPAGTGLLIGTTDRRGKTTQFGYDAANLTTVTSPLGEFTTQTYDGVGRRLTRVDPRGNVVGADPAQFTTTFAYDESNNLILVTDPLGHHTATVFDLAGNRTSSTDANDHATNYGYDAANRLTTVTNADQKTTTYAYDVVGNLTSRLDAKQHQTTYEYDLAHRLTKTTDPLLHSWTIGYDAAGNLTSRKDANNNTTTFAFDEIGRLTGITYQNPSTPPVTFGYDANGNQTSMTDGAGTESSTYDVNDRVTNVTRGTDTFTYGYDATGHILSRTSPGGIATTYTFNDDGEMASATSLEPNVPPADTTAPTVPTGLSATTVSSNQINLAWTASTDDVGVQGYKIYRGGTYLATIGPVGTTSLADTGLTAGTAYSYTVSAIDGAGNESAQSSSTGATTTPSDTAAPTIPTGVAANASAYNQVGLTWTASTDNVAVTRYSIFRGGTLLASVNGTTTSFTDRSSAPSTAYSYTVKASDAAGNTSPASTAAPATTPACGPCAGSTTFNPVADAYVNNASGQNKKNFGTATTLLVASSGDKKSFLKFDTTTLPAGAITGATLRVYATVADTAGFGVYPSSTTSWTETGITYQNAPATGALIATSGAVTANAYKAVAVSSAVTTRGLVTLVMANATSSNGTYQSRENTNKPQLVVTTVAPPPADTTAPTVPTGLSATTVSSNQINLAWTASTDDVGVQGYKIYRGGTYLATIGPVGTTSLADTGLTAGTAYSYTVSAIDGAGNESAQSSSTGATTTPSDTAAPTIPTGVAANASAYNQVGLTWTASTDNVAVTRYSIFRGGTLLASVNGTTTSFTDRSSAPSTAYSYTVKASDAAGNTSPASTAAPATTPALPSTPTITNYTYDPAGNLLTEASPDGVTAKYAYDRAGRLLEIANVTTAATISRFSYALDAAGNRTVMTTTRGSQYFTYDTVDRLTGACYAASCAGAATPVTCLGCVGSPASAPAASTVPDPADISTAWTYDAVGNRSTETNYQGQTTYAYDNADRLTSTTAPGSVVTNYGYDANGNETSAGTTSFTYDLADRLSTATVGTTTETYSYAGDGVRLASSRGAGAANTTQFIVDRVYPLPQLALERDGNGSVLRRFVRGLDLIGEKSTATPLVFDHHDGLGTITDLTDAGGAILAWNETRPFGQVRSAGSVGGAPTNPFGFAGEYRDGVTGLYHLRARQYDPATGRFLTTDPVRPPIGDPYVAAYVYGAGNPVVMTDPSGRCLLICGLVGAAVGAAIGGVVYLATTPSSEWSLGGLASDAGIGAASGFVVGFTGGAAGLAVASGELSLGGAAILTGTGGYAAGYLTTGLQAARGDKITPEKFAWNMIGSTLAGAVGGEGGGGWIRDLFGARALTADVINVGTGIAAEGPFDWPYPTLGGVVK